MIELYYKPEEIRWRREEIIWLIPYLPLLRSGVYPRDPGVSESGYTDTPVGKRQVKAKASFITASEIAAELDTRLQSCNSDGLFLEMVYSQPDDKYFVMNHIAMALGVDINQVDKRLNNVLKYIQGFKRKRRNFQEWAWHKKGMS